MNGYKWIINERGYANVVEVGDGNSTSTDPSEDKHGNGEDGEDENAKKNNSDYSNCVFGLVYSLQPKDEERLDLNEGVPVAYTKEHLLTEFWESKNGKWVDVTKRPTKSTYMLVYIDRNRTGEDSPKKEYIYRMNRGIEDAVKMGVPEGYVRDVMRRFIPKDKVEGEEKKRMAEKALRQAGRFKDESGVF